MSGYGNKGGTDGDSGTAHRDRDTHGALLGVDRLFADGGRAGMLVGYGRTNLALAEQRGRADIDSVHAGVFGERRLGAGALRGGAFYSHQRIAGRRTSRRSSSRL